MAIADKLKRAWQNRGSLLALLEQGDSSWSQYGEDVIFARLLHPTRRGVYVDVGANHPIGGSNTYRLYLRGWSGVTIEPNPAFTAMFRKKRPRDTHLCEGVSLTRSSLSYYEFKNAAFNTFSEQRRDALVARGEPITHTRSVICRPLAEIVKDKLPGGQIDLLNVDCEGLDLQVLQSLDLTCNRPTVMIVENFLMFHSLRTRAPVAEFETFLREHRYQPIAQTAWSAILVAEDWPDLFAKSGAYKVEATQNGYLPGQ